MTPLEWTSVSAHSPVGINDASPKTWILSPKLDVESGLYFHPTPKTESHCCCFAFSLCDSTGLSRIRSAYNRQSAEMPLHNNKYIWPFDGSVKLCIARYFLGADFVCGPIHISCTSPSRAFALHLKHHFFIYNEIVQSQKTVRNKNNMD